MSAASDSRCWLQLRLVSMCLLLLLPQSVGELHRHSSPKKHFHHTSSTCFALMAAAGIPCRGAFPAAVRKPPALLLASPRRGGSFGVGGEELLGRRINTSASFAISKIYDIYAHGVRDDDVYGQRAGASYGNHYGPSAGHTWAAEAVIQTSLRLALGRDGVQEERRAAADAEAEEEAGEGDKKDGEYTWQPVVQSSRGSEEVQLKGERTTRDKGARRSVGGKGKKKEERRVSRQERYKEMVQVGRGGNEGEVGGFGGKVESEVAVAGSAHMVEVVAAGSIRARPVLNIESHGAMLCRIVARALLHVVRVTVLSDKGRKTYQGLVTEVLNHQPADDTFNSSLQAEHTFCLLAKEGLMISVAVSSVEELVVLTLAGSPDLAALHHAATSTQSGGGWGRARNTLLTPTLHAMVLQPPFLVPAEAMDDENLILLRSLGESYGRRVLVQNLRHVLVGLSGYRALWSDFLMLTSLVQESSSSSSSSRPPPSPTASVFVHGLGAGRGFAGEGGIQGWVDLKRRGWMVKVLPDVETYREAVSLGGVDGKWVSVSEILPMSDYDLETYNTYRHQVLPSSEFDLQRHDSALHLRYSSSSSSSDYDV